MKLTIELVPETAWYSNLRAILTKEQWDIVRKKSYKQAGYKCEICGDVGLNQGFKHPVECHEIWEYDDKKKIQTLTGVVSLCPYCHKVKHPGLANIKGESEIVIKQLMKVNKMTRNEATKYIDSAFALWSVRSKSDWETKVDWVWEFLIDNLL